MKSLHADELKYLSEMATHREQLDQSKIKELEANLRSLHNKLTLQRPSNSFVLAGGTNLLNFSFTEGRGFSARGSRNECGLSSAAYPRSPQSAGRHGAMSFDRDVSKTLCSACKSKKQRAVATRLERSGDVPIDAPCILRTPAKVDAASQADLAQSLKEKDLAEIKRQMNQNLKNNKESTDMLRKHVKDARQEVAMKEEENKVLKAKLSTLKLQLSKIERVSKMSPRLQVDTALSSARGSRAVKKSN